MTGPPLPLLLLIAVATAAAQPPSPPSSVQVTFRPSIAVVIGIFSIMFSLTFLLLMYGKFCRSNTTGLFTATGFIISGNGNRADDPRSSGIDKSVIESLPFFRFSALKGSREGLECSVCLSRYDGDEILRLLPRCKHAFHNVCIDQWLESHSSCPLCRTRVDADDIAFFKCSEVVEEGGEAGVELYVERETARRAEPLHNFKHRILVSQVVFNSRWSDFNSADFISLDSEMLRVISSRRFDPPGEGISRIKEEMERKRRLVQMQMGVEERSSEFVGGEMRALISPASRCMSDISAARSCRASGSYGEIEEKVRQKWLPIARRTVQWFAGKEGRTMLRQDGEENV